ncbi:MAG: hypothetical protein H6732_08015 [Alphaproteobacteria bacterium]|nr:hypothetical protein [Alphaproteobacteria bacterium]
MTFGLGELLVLGALLLLVGGGALRERIARVARERLERQVRSAVPPGVQRAASLAQELLERPEAEEDGEEAPDEEGPDHPSAPPRP